MWSRCDIELLFHYLAMDLDLRYKARLLLIQMEFEAMKEMSITYNFKQMPYCYQRRQIILYTVSITLKQDQLYKLS
jgi:hypothetical protein